MKMSSPNLVMIGTRDRPHNAIRAFEQLKEVSVESDFLIIINEDQQDLYSAFSGYDLELSYVMREVVPSELGCIGKANHILPKYWDSYQTITGIDDDCMVTTHAWDMLLALPIEERGYGISYGNDTMQGQNLPTKVMISTNILKVLGFWAPTSLFHLYADNFWKALGTELGSLNYFSDVMMEHWHYLNGKAPQDDLYRSIYAPGEMEKANEAFTTYIKDEFAGDIERVKAALSNNLE